MRAIGDRQFGRTLGAWAVLAILASQPAWAAEGSQFSTPTIDLGTVVSDAARSVKFYTEVVGFKEVPGFKLAAPLGAEAGLTDGKQPIDVRVLVLGEGPGATKLKLLEFKNAGKADNTFIHSQAGFRYLTIFVTDTTAALERLKKYDVKPLAKTPTLIPKELGEGIYLTVIRDPDGNIVELVGPKK